MSLKNKAAILHGPYDIRIEEWPTPEIKDDEVLLRMECVGICGSDVQIYSKGRCGEDVLTEPVIIGHEGAGVIVEVGPRVSCLKVGDRVAIEPTQPCRVCEYCKIGRYNLCLVPKYCCFGAPGNMSRYYKHVADFCHRIPDNLSMAEGAAVQPLAIAIHACNRANIRLGSKVLILGAGPIGVLCAMTAKAMGATSIVITDLLESRLVTAKKLGVNHALLAKYQATEADDEDMETNIVKLIGKQPDITIEACGDEFAQRLALKVTKSGGLVLVVGIKEGSVTVPLSGALLREVDIKGSIRFNNTYPTALDVVSSGKIDLKSIITHNFSLDEVREALEVARRGAAMKAIVHLQK